MPAARSEAEAALVRRRVGGLLLLAVGALALFGLWYVSNCRSEACERAMIAVGLAGSVMISAVAQLLVALGAWQLWLARPRWPRAR